MIALMTLAFRSGRNCANAARPLAGVCGVALLLGLCAPLPGAAAAAAHDHDRFFGLTNLWTIHLTFRKSAWDTLQVPDRRWGGPGGFAHDYPWSVCRIECAGETLTNVAVRFKGNSSFNASRHSAKHPLRVNFARGSKGRAFLGVKELSLNNNFNDATQFREALAYDACRIAGLAAPRTAFARVYLTIEGGPTNQYLGLYTAVEPVDGPFLKAHFGGKKGLLLKPERVPTIAYLGPDWNAYTNHYAPKTEATAADTRRFITLAQIITESDDATFARELPKRVDVANLLRYVAMMSMLANYDSFVGNGHNYYFFQPTDGAKAVFIPWDLNEAFGGHPMAGPRQIQAELSVLHPQAGRNRLIDRVLANTNWAAAYRAELNADLAKACNPARLKATAERLAKIVQPAVAEESPAARVNFQRIALGETNLAAPRPAPGPGGREEMGLADWITKRMENIEAELAGKRDAPLPRMQGFPGRGGGRPPPGGRPGFWGGPPERPQEPPPPRP